MLYVATVIGVLVVFAALLSRADYHQVGARVRERLVPVGVPLLLMVGWFAGASWLGHRDTPALSAVNGVYTSPCCAAIELKNGVLVTGQMRLPFKLEMTKVGLVGAPPVTIEVRDGTIKAVPDPVLKVGWSGAKTEMVQGSYPAHFIFADDHKSFTLCNHLCRTEYQFVRH